MPASGLFSTAGDLVRFARMILNRGVSQSKWYLSEAAVAESSRSRGSYDTLCSIMCAHTGTTANV